MCAITSVLTLINLASHWSLKIAFDFIGGGRGSGSDEEIYGLTIGTILYRQCDKYIFVALCNGLSIGGGLVVKI